MSDAEESGAALLARYYDLDIADACDDLALYEALAQRTGGPILELGVGTGRLAVPLASRGFEVVGVDSDAAMLQRADLRLAALAVQGNGSRGARRLRERARRAHGTPTLELVESDLFAPELGASRSLRERRFGLVILALNTLLLLGDAERQARAVAILAGSLRPDGLAVIDVILPGTEDLGIYDGRLVLDWQRDDPETGGRVAKLASAVYEPATRVVEVDTIFDSWPTDGGALRRVARRDRLHLVTAAELVRFATDAGLAVETLAGDYDLTPFGPGAERAVLIARLL